MELIEPGYSAKKLVTAGDDDAATRAICQVIRRLQPQMNSKNLFKSVSDLGADLRALHGVDSYLLDKGKSLIKELTKDSSTDLILHGDIHHDNILFAKGEWVAIDPHGYVGPRAFEVGAMMTNPINAFPSERPLKEVIRRRLDILKEELPFDADEILGWAFTYTLISASWSAGDHRSVPAFDLAVLEVLDSINF